MLLQSALEPLVATWVDLLYQSIKSKELRGRGVLAYAVKATPLLCKEARDYWRAERRAPYLLAYCNYSVFNCGHRARYLDALPLFVLSAPPPVVIEEGALPSPTVHDVHEDRAKQVRQLEATLTDTSSDESDLQCTYPVPGLPLAVRCLIGRVEEMHHRYKRHAWYARFFCTCQRVGCTRPALLQPPAIQPDSKSSDAEYWTCCRDGRAPAPDAHLPNDMSFCSHGCFAAANSEFQRIVSFEIVTPPCQAPSGERPTPELLFRAALQRNSRLEQTLCQVRKQKTVHYPSKKADHARLLRDRITMLSVDAGLLYAMSNVYHLSRASPSRPAHLPRKENWRKSAACYLGAIVRVRELYLKYGRGRITKTVNDRWLRKVKDLSLHIFVE